MSPLRLTRIVAPMFFLCLSAAISGCGSIESHTAGAVESAAAAEIRYSDLDSTLADAILRLEGLADAPGGAEAYLQAVGDVDARVVASASAMRGAREALLEHGREHVRLLNEEAAKFTDRDLGRRFVVEAERLRRCYAVYESGTSGPVAHLDLAHRYIADVRRVVESNRTEAGVAMVRSTLKKAVAELKSAAAGIPDSRKALAGLRREQPTPAERL